MLVFGVGEGPVMRAMHLLCQQREKERASPGSETGEGGGGGGERFSANPHGSGNGQRFQGVLEIQTPGKYMVCSDQSRRILKGPFEELNGHRPCRRNARIEALLALLSIFKNFKSARLALE